MKYLLFPIHLFKFWYIESLYAFLRIWKNSINYLEEDLAVGLMLKLIFVPLFHDNSYVGRILSFIFRIFRILIGVFAFIIATIFILVGAIYWLFLPLFAFYGMFSPISEALLFSGVTLFAIHVFTHPHKKVWQINLSTDSASSPQAVSGQDFWESSAINKKSLNYQKLLQDRTVQQLLLLLEISAEKFKDFSLLDTEEVGKNAFLLARKTESEYIDGVHFFIADLMMQHGIEQFLLQFDLRIQDFINAVIYMEKRQKSWRMVMLWDDDFAIHHLKGINRGWLSVPTPHLDEVSVDLTKQVAKDGFQTIVIGRQKVVAEVINILSQESTRNVLVVGEAGTGKSVFMHFLAKKIVSGNAPSALATKRLVEIDTTRLLSGIRTQGELAERIKAIFEEVRFCQNIILVLEEIHNLGIGEAGTALNLYSLILPYLDSGDYQFIATTEPENYTKILEKNNTFAQLFTKIEFPPTSPEETIQVLEERAIQIAKKRKLQTTFIAIKKTVELASKYIHDRVLPDSALVILKEAEPLATDKWVNSKTIETVLSRRVNVPIGVINGDQKEKLLNLEQEIHQRLIDQVEAVRVIADALRRSATGLREGHRPIGSFLFLGPTGVGKTELAKILAEVYFKNAGAFLRFDMSEYQNSESVNRLIGKAGETGLLTEAVRGKPYALLLLDEFEKADPKILTLFLQVLEDGRLTGGDGKTIDFTNTIIIATSNASSLIIAKGLQAGMSLEQLDKQVNDELLHLFKPELINRFDDIVLFKPLSQEDLEKVVKLKLLALQTRLSDQGYLVEFDEGLVAKLAEKGFDPILGARPLRRLIQDTLEAKLSKMILENKLLKGQTINLGLEILA